MSVELYTEDAPPAVVFLLSWLAPLGGGIGQTRTGNDATTFPFRQVSILDVTPDENLSADTVLASVHTFCKAETPAERAAALAEARRTDQRMMLLQHDLDPVELPDGTIANCEFLCIKEKSALRDYKVDTIHRYKGVFEFALSYAAV